MNQDNKNTKMATIINELLDNSYTCYICTDKVDIIKNDQHRCIRSLNICNICINPMCFDCLLRIKKCPFCNTSLTDISHKYYTMMNGKLTDDPCDKKIITVIRNDLKKKLKLINRIINNN